MELTKEQENFINKKLHSLAKSKFRSSFKLREHELNYIKDKSLAVIAIHCEEFINNRLAPAIIENDGKQTPMRGHPVFIAQHATATCCRSCLYKWHHIAKNKELSAKEKRFINALIMAWIEQNSTKVKAIK